MAEVGGGAGSARNPLAMKNSLRKGPFLSMGTPFSLTPQGPEQEQRDKWEQPGSGETRGSSRAGQ